MQSYGIRHTKTAIYSPQSSAAEPVNQSVLNAIRAYLEQCHSDWDLYLPEIEKPLRSSIHQATGTTPYFALFWQHMFTNGADYRLTRKLQALEDSEISNLGRKDRLTLLRVSNIYMEHMKPVHGITTDKGGK